MSSLPLPPEERSMANNERKIDHKAVAAYGKAVEHATLDVIRLVSSSFKVDPAFHDQEMKRFIAQEVQGVDYNEETGSLFGMVLCRCWMAPKASDSEASAVSKDTKLLSIDAEYIILFSVTGEHTKDTMQTFFNQIAPMSVWPYFRSHVASKAAEGHVEIPTLPLKKLVRRVALALDYVDPDVET